MKHCRGRGKAGEKPSRVLHSSDPPTDYCPKAESNVPFSFFVGQVSLPYVPANPHLNVKIDEVVDQVRCGHVHISAVQPLAYSIARLFVFVKVYPARACSDVVGFLLCLEPTRRCLQLRR